MITGRWAQTLTASRFLLTNDRNSGIVVFATQQFLQLLKRQLLLLMGLPRLAPIPLNNFVIFGTFDERKTPLIFWFLEGKTTHHSRRLFQIIKQKMGQKFSTGPPKKYFWFRDRIDSSGTKSFLMQFIGALISISRRRFSAKFKIRASKSLTEETKNWFFFWKIISVGFLPLEEIRNAIVDLLDEEPTLTLLFRYPELRDFFAISSQHMVVDFAPRNVERFRKTFQNANKYLRRVEQFLEPVVGGPISGWRSDSWKFKKE